MTGFEPLPDGTWRGDTVRTGRWLRRQQRSFTATHVVLAAGTWGTQRLLFKMRDKGKLPKLSDRLGVLTRTNSESILGAGRPRVTPDLDLTHGVAITSSIHPDPDTHIEPVRYGKGSNAMGLLQTLMIDGSGPEGTDVPRWRQFLAQRARASTHPLPSAQRAAVERAHGDRAGDAAPGQLDHHVHRARPSWAPAGDSASRVTASRTRPGSRSGNEVTRRIAAKIDGVAGGTWGELFNIPLTAHFLGGAAIGDSPEHGVVDPYQRVYGYPDAVGDGRRSGLGEPRVNPSLTITAQAERAASLWPNQGEADQRPAAGQPTAGSPRSRRRTRWFPRTRRRPCVGRRPNRSAQPASLATST